MSLPISKKPIIVIGCHRSGTSLVSEILLSAGVDMGSNKDHFEDIWFMTANENLLAINGASWFEPKAINSLPKRMVAGASKHVGRKSGIWGWKDPRNSFTLKAWLELFPEANVIWVHRNGIDVANSLMVREGKKNPQNPLFAERCLSYTGALTLWDQYEKSCALVTRDLPKDRILHLCFEQLCANPQQEMSKMFLFCGLSETDIDFNSLPEIDDSRAWAFSN